MSPFTLALDSLSHEVAITSPCSKQAPNAASLQPMLLPSWDVPSITGFSTFPMPPAAPQHHALTLLRRTTNTKAEAHDQHAASQDPAANKNANFLASARHRQPRWTHASPRLSKSQASPQPAWDLVACMLTRDVSARLTADEVLSHPWVLFHTEATMEMVALKTKMKKTMDG